jgi:hypothetical protein
MSELIAARIANEVGAAEALVSDVVSRLRLVKGDMSDVRFNALVKDVVRTKLRFAERDAREDLSVVRPHERDD